jgi:hypothetical protein
VTNSSAPAEPVGGAKPSAARYDLNSIPFSCRGSWLDLSPVIGFRQRSEHVHLVSHRTALTGVLALVPTDPSGTPISAVWEASPAVLRWRTFAGVVEAVFADDRTLRLRGRNVGMAFRAADPELTSFTGTYLFRDPSDHSWTFTSYETGRRYRITPLSGGMVGAGVEALGSALREVLLQPAEDGAWEVAIEELETAKPQFVADRSFDRVVAEVATDFDRFVDLIAPWRGPETPAASLAAYVLWSATVAPAGFVGRESVLMSMHWMDSVWSWDHCFNAVALAADPELALAQFLLPFDHRDATGALPDSVTHSRVLYNFVKPPIHGWAFARLREQLAAPLDRDTLVDVYERLADWSNFWLRHRVGVGRTLPSYQHGNDSGWDNSTVFDLERVVETADLAAFLSLQLDVLARLAGELGRGGDALMWEKEAARLRAALLAELWDGERFTAFAPFSGRRIRSESLLTALPIIIGDLLPAEVTKALVGQIQSMLTEHGPATEPVDSADFETDGYWRGPIWAPSTMIIEDGLRRSGFADLADDISTRFRRLCERSGFAENFDAVSGRGLRDRAYTWTAAVYLILAGEHASRRRAANQPAGR